MKQYDPLKAAQVWQRVQNQPSTRSGPENLAALIMTQWETAAFCRRMPEPAMKHISQTAQRHIQCLKGIQHLATGRPAEVRTPAVEVDLSPAGLRKCYGKMLRCLGEYEKRCDDPEYGPVFRNLAREQRDCCCKLLEFIGSQDRKKG